MPPKRAKADESRYVVQSVIICDDVRQESNGKEILIGVYNDVMLFSAFPAVLPHLNFRIVVDFRGERFEHFTVAIHDDGANVPRMSMTQPVGATKAGQSAIVLVGTGQIKFSQPTTLSVLFGADREPVRIGGIAVRLAQGEESKRMQPL